jgi:aryl-alcohol dehydrogenase-like predicted oxidoreductase
MRYKLFGRSGLRVSELALGTMTFGTEWGWGSDYDTSKQVFDAYANAGGNFLDTANRYTEGTSEKWLGEFIGTERDHFVLATKYTLFDRKTDPNFSGNHRKNLMRSVEESLKRLRTGFIDLLWVHAWDFTTHVDEVMRGLDDLVRMGKVHYIGISDTPAWIVSQANTLADLRGWTPFVGLQLEYSLIERTPERDLLPMAKAFDLAVTPWASLGSGVLTGKYLNKETGRLKENSIKLTDRNQQIAQEVVNIAEEIGVSAAQVAINWTRQGRDQVVIPIIGASKGSQIQDNLACINFQLSPAQLERLNQVSTIDLGFPHEFLKRASVNIYGETEALLDNHRK